MGSRGLKVVVGSGREKIKGKRRCSKENGMMFRDFMAELASSLCLLSFGGCCFLVFRVGATLTCKVQRDHIYICIYIAVARKLLHEISK